MTALLELKDITNRFMGLVARDHINHTVTPHDIIGLIGPNGAGKTTLFSVISGYLKPEEGEIYYKGERITGKPTHEICHKGICRTFQIVKPFSEMNVLENVMVGAFHHTSSVKLAKEKAMSVLEFCGLTEKAGLLGKELTIENKKRLEVARALATDPDLLLLDEVMAGLNPVEVHQAVDFIYKIHEKGYTLLVIEHVMEVIMPISDRVVVLDYGKKIADCDPEEAVKKPEVINAYFGSTEE